jgi:hypothetical protein
MSLRRGSMRCRDSRQISREVAAGVHQAQNAVPAVTFAEPKELLKDNFGKHEIIRRHGNPARNLPKTPVGTLSKKEQEEEAAKRAHSPRAEHLQAGN